MPTITSLGVGSGLDLTGLLDQLAKGEQQKLVPLAQQKVSYQAKLSAFGKLQGALSAFQVAALKLDNVDLFNSVKSSVSGEGVAAAARAEAQPGSYQVEVTQLARAYSVATQGVADKTAELGAGTVTMTLANGESVSVTLEDGASSLEDLRDAINTANGGVNASIVNDGSGTPYRLVLSSSATGLEAAISDVDFGTVALTEDAGTEISALNAELTINNIAISSQGNRVEEAIEGVTLDLSATGTSTLKIDSDTDTMRDAVKSFVTAYNTLRSSITSLGKFDAESGAKGDLLGDPALRSVQNSLRMTMSSGVAEGELHLLSDVGITLQLDGSLKLDDAKLDKLLTTDRAALRDFFAGSKSDSEGGLADSVDGLIKHLLGSDGAVGGATKGLEDNIKRVDERADRMNLTIESTIERYRKQFAQLDSLVASMNAQSGYLTQQFDMMNAQLNQK
jgi:flagellar hook-associated protein 2